MQGLDDYTCWLTRTQGFRVLVGHCAAKEQQQAVKFNALQVVLQPVLKGTNNCHQYDIVCQEPRLR